MPVSVYEGQDVAGGEMAVIEMNLYSHVLEMDMDLYIVLPKEMQENKYRTLWLFHGGNGDHGDWLRSVRIDDIANERGIAIIMPGVHNSCFVDMKHGGAYGTYVGRELPELVRKFFPALSGQQKDNAAAGFSNGGYGVLRLAMTYPEIYGYVGGFAAGDKADKEFVNDGSCMARERICMFGDGDIKETEYSIGFQARKNLASQITLPVVFHACGRFDPWRDMNEKVRDVFQSFEGNPYSYQYKEYTVHAHTNPFRERALEDFLDHIGW